MSPFPVPLLSLYLSVSISVSLCPYVCFGFIITGVPLSRSFSVSASLLPAPETHPGERGFNAKSWGIHVKIEGVWVCVLLFLPSVSLVPPLPPFLPSLSLPLSPQLCLALVIDFSLCIEHRAWGFAEHRVAFGDSGSLFVFRGSFGWIFQKAEAGKWKPFRKRERHLKARTEGGRAMCPKHGPGQPPSRWEIHSALGRGFRRQLLSHQLA